MSIETWPHDNSLAEEKGGRLTVAVFDDDVDDVASVDIIAKLVNEDHKHDIKLRTMSWQKVTWLLAGEQVCLAIMGQSWALSILGWVPGITMMVVAGILFFITSMTMHSFIMRHPRIMDICDFGYYLFGESKVAYCFTAVMLLANNVVLVGFHVLTGAQILNTLSDNTKCSLVLAVITMVVGIVLSLPRTLHHVSFMSVFSATCMGIAILLFLIFAAIEKTPSKGPDGVEYPGLGEVNSYAFPRPDTTWHQGLSAVLVIFFLWVPQILFPTIIAEMERPQDFPKALTVLAGMSAFLFIVPPAIGFRYLGQYAKAPAFASLGIDVYRKASFAFVLVPDLIIGVIYGNVTGKFIYYNIMKTSDHAHSNTVVGWGVWVSVMAGIWIIGFILAEVIPGMSDFMSLLSAAFNPFFGFIFFAVAWYQMHKGRLFASFGKTVKSVVHMLVMIVGLFLLGPGFYATVIAIKAAYTGDRVATFKAFSC